MFNVKMSRLLTPLDNRGMTHVKNNDGTVTINDKIFDRERDVEAYLSTIPRNDLK